MVTVSSNPTTTYTNKKLPSGKGSCFGAGSTLRITASTFYQRNGQVGDFFSFSSTFLLIFFPSPSTHKGGWCG